MKIAVLVKQVPDTNAERTLGCGDHTLDHTLDREAATAVIDEIMLCAPGEPMLTLVDEEELAQRAHLRAPRPTE